MHRSLWLFVLATGCDYAFRVDHVDEPTADATAPCVEIGHDEDNDGLDDACDPCPFDASNQGDADGDGISDACDPAPTLANTVLLFDGFGSINPALIVRGGLITDDVWRPVMNDTNAVLWMTAADPIWVVAGVDVAGQTSASYREVGVVFDAMSGLDAVDGTYCALGRSSVDYVQVFTRSRPDNDQDIVTQSSPLALAAMRSGLMRAQHARGVSPGTSCVFTNNMDQQAGIGGVRTPPPPQGGVAIFGTQVEATFTFMFVVGPG